MYSAKEAAKITGLSTATLRYYEKEKLLPQIARNSQKYRQYTDEDIEWIKMIQCMRMANIPIHSIKEYEDIKKQITHLQNAFDLTQKKLSFYEKLLASSSYKEMSYSEEWKLFNHGEK